MAFRFIAGALAALSVVTGAATLQRRAAGMVHLDITTKHRLQRIDGFGSSLVAGFEAFERGHFDQVVPQGVTYKTTAEQRAKIVSTAIVELGVSHLRIWLWPLGIEPVNDNDDPDVVNWANFRWKGQGGKPQAADILENRQNGIVEIGDFLKEAVPLGLQNWILTPGRLPPWVAAMFKESHPQRFEEYAEWAAVKCLYLKREYGLEPPYWSMFNEPDVAGWKAPEIWIPWLKAVGRRFRKEGLNTKIVFPDTAGVQNALSLSEEVLKDGEIRGYLGALAYHHYRSSGKGPQPFLKVIEDPGAPESVGVLAQVTAGPMAMAELGRRHGLPSWQTETAYYPTPLKGLTEWEIGLARANEIQLELVSGAAAVEGMMLFWPDAIDPRYGHTVRHEGHHIVLRTDRRVARQWEVTKDAGIVFAHYGRFVRPGDWRVEVITTDAQVRASAFTSKSGLSTIAVLLNNARQAREVVIPLLGMPACTAITAFITDEKTSFRRFTPSRVSRGDNCSVVLSARSLATVIWTRQPVRPPMITPN